MANGTFGGGDGTVALPFLVEDAQDFNAIRNSPASSYAQVNDIDMSEYTNFPPIASFEGFYDGRGKIIDNVTIMQSSSANTAIFGHVNNTLVNSISPSLLNINVRNLSINHSTAPNPGLHTGGLVGQAHSCLITNCHVEGSIKSSTFTTGGVVGYSSSAAKFSLRSSSFKGNITKSSAGGAGGVIGHSLGSGFESSINDRRSHENLLFDGSIVSDDIAGGVIGVSGQWLGTSRFLAPKLFYLESRGSVEAINTAGGIVGHFDVSNELYNSFSSCSVRGKNAGGIAGYLNYMHSSLITTIRNCYSSGVITSVSGALGGLLGYVDQVSTSQTSALIVDACYTLSPYLKQTSPTTNNNNRIIGRVPASGTTVTNTYALNSMYLVRG